MLTKQLKCCILKTRVSLISSRVPHVILGEIPESWLFASPQEFVSICKSLLSLAKHCRGPLDAMWPSVLGEIIAAEPQVSGLFFMFDGRDSLPVICTTECCKVE